MSFHEVDFPEIPGYGTQGGPGWKTEIITVDSGAEQRVSRWASPRRRWTLNLENLDRDDAGTLLDFIQGRQGAAHGFRFSDPADYTTSSDHRSSPDDQDVLIGTGDGSDVTFQLKKNYYDGLTTRERTLTKIVAGTTVVSLDGVASIDREGTVTSGGGGTTLVDSAATFQTWGIRVGQVISNDDDGSTGVVESVDSETQITHSALSGGTENDWDVDEAYTIHKGWSVNTATGLVTFTTAPLEGVEIKAGCQFLVPARFGDTVDELLGMHFTEFDIRNFSIEVVELLEEGEHPESFFYGGSTRIYPWSSITLSVIEGRVVYLDPQQAGLNCYLPVKSLIAPGGGAPIMYLINGSDSIDISIREHADDGGAFLFTLSAEQTAVMLLSYDGLSTYTWHAK